jgi:hypothetical protein
MYLILHDEHEIRNKNLFTFENECLKNQWQFKTEQMFNT